MENPTRKVAAAGAAALLAAGLVVTGAGAASASAGKAERITSATQLKESIRLAAALEREAGVAQLGDPIGGAVTGLGARSASC